MNEEKRNTDTPEDRELAPEAIEELSNGKGEDEDE